MFNGMMIRSVSGLVSGFTLLCAAAVAAPPPSLALPPAADIPTPAASASSSPASLEPPPGYQPPPKTLERIAQRGAIYVAHREASIPFSYTDGEGRVHGYSWELCMRIVDAVKARLNQPSIEVVPVFATSSSRIMMVESGVVDLYCGSSTNTEQRARYVSFSNTYFVAGVKGLVRKDSGIRSVDDLKGRTVVTTAGTTSDGYVKGATARRNIFVNLRTARTHDDAFNEVLSGKADVFVLDDILLKGLLANSSQADAYKLVILDESFGFEPYGLMLRKGDPEFKRIVDETLLGLYRSGEIERIYAKWFQSAIPPKGINLDLPMGPELKQLIKTPNDRGI